MVNIDSSVFPKMKALYDLYDKYYEYTNTTYWRDYSDKCRTIGQAMQYHNKIIDDYQDDDYLVKKSIDMKRLIEQLELQPSHECNYYKSELKKSKLDILQLDPSLEEEDDESVKFLVVLEDLHQEISQISRNMVVGMLDIVQWI
ncbi:hypothetical protein PVIIG_05614 [Plasmodium vivax India VII]|uniref:Uncharacterized protein n=1 Tax=Plasmodium vivax India VII TaxID=1077284 RepID=A0A0J9S2U2_PLAVI|nr:hypothetical protein PVIIG_05614 [Plasmodium vivax India VII]